MSESIAAQPPARWVLWTSRILSAIPALMVGFSAVMKLVRAPPVVQAMTAQFGYPSGFIVPIGVVELSCAVLYVIPRTTVLGAVLLTGYLGGAVATHVRISDPSFVGPLTFGIMAWAGLYLREPRLRALLPMRTS